MARYTRTLSGQCEPWDQGEYETEEDCLASAEQNLTRQDVDLIYLTLGYDLETALRLGPSDLATFVRREFNLRLHPDEARAVLEAIIERNYLYLSAYPEFQAYLSQRLTVLDRYLVELIHQVPTPFSPRRVNWTEFRNAVEDRLIVTVITLQGLGLTLEDAVRDLELDDIVENLALQAIAVYYRQLGVPNRLDAQGNPIIQAPVFPHEIITITRRYMPQIYRQLWNRR